MPLSVRHSARSKRAKPMSRRDLGAHLLSGASSACSGGVARFFARCFAVALRTCPSALLFRALLPMGPRSSGARAGRASDNCPILLPRTRRDCRCANRMCRFFFEGRGSAVEFPECDQPAPRRLQINYLTILYMVTPSPLGQTPCLTGTTNLVVTGTKTAPHASDRVAKKAPLQINPLQTPAPSLAKTK